MEWAVLNIKRLAVTSNIIAKAVNSGIQENTGQVPQHQREERNEQKSKAFEKKAHSNTNNVVNKHRVYS